MREYSEPSKAPMEAIPIKVSPMWNTKEECGYCRGSCPVSWWVMCNCWVGQLTPDRPPLCPENTCQNCDFLREPFPDPPVELGGAKDELGFCTS